MFYPIELISLQIAFVEHLAKMHDRDFLDYLPYYSQLFFAFEISRSVFHPNNPIWLDFVNNYYSPEDKVGSFVAFMNKRTAEVTPEASENKFGYFRYEVEVGNKCVKVHTVPGPVSTNTPSPLSKELYNDRINDLTQMFAHIKKHYSEHVESVRGKSWLYHINAYKRLFPASYYSDPQINFDTFSGLSLWGQFLDKTYGVKSAIAKPFLEKLAVSQDYATALKSFEYPCLTVKGPISDFYRMYKV